MFCLTPPKRNRGRSRLYVHVSRSVKKVKYGLDLGGNFHPAVAGQVQNVKAIMSASGSWRIDESGLLVVEEVRAKRGTFEEKLEIGSQEKPGGITIYDKATGLPKCVVVENDIVRSEPRACGTETLSLEQESNAPPESIPETE